MLVAGNTADQVASSDSMKGAASFRLASPGDYSPALAGAALAPCWLGVTTSMLLSGGSA
ncbi:MAG: hypothetical protein M3Y42_01425 [Actinomycetota bacterium]|nr:hypothetical protein [Actinomycetota bacterium]MDQ2955609.1 hypothetical protein [Actinomycetota bacterium]